MNDSEIEKRFWKFVSIGTGCWVWTGSKTSTGYGDFRYGHDNRIKAHRYSYYLFYGNYPKNFCCHKCNNPLCVNPKHLYDGTPKDNSQDMVNSGRHVSQLKTHCPKGHEYTEKNTYIHKNGSRRCKKCNMEYYKRINQRS